MVTPTLEQRSYAEASMLGTDGGQMSGGDNRASPTSSLRGMSPQLLSASGAARPWGAALQPAPTGPDGHLGSPGLGLLQQQICDNKKHHSEGTARHGVIPAFGEAEAGESPVAVQPGKLCHFARPCTTTRLNCGFSPSSKAGVQRRNGVPRHVTQQHQRWLCLGAPVRVPVPRRAVPASHHVAQSGRDLGILLLQSPRVLG